MVRDGHGHIWYKMTQRSVCYLNFKGQNWNFSVRWLRWSIWLRWLRLFKNSPMNLDQHPEVEKVWHPGILDARRFFKNQRLAESFWPNPLPNCLPDKTSHKWCNYLKTFCLLFSKLIFFCWKCAYIHFKQKKSTCLQNRTAFSQKVFGPNIRMPETLSTFSTSGLSFPDLM